MAFDCVGAGPLYFPEEHLQLASDDRLALAILKLVERGFASQLVLSHGYCLKVGLFSHSHSMNYR